MHSEHLLAIEVTISATSSDYCARNFEQNTIFTAVLCFTVFPPNIIS